MLTGIRAHNKKMYISITNLRILLTVAGGILMLVALVSTVAMHRKAREARDRVAVVAESQQQQIDDMFAAF